MADCTSSRMAQMWLVVMLYGSLRHTVVHTKKASFMQNNVENFTQGEPAVCHCVKPLLPLTCTFASDEKKSRGLESSVTLLCSTR